MELSDEELYERIRKGDRQALAELYDRREPALYRYALQLCGNRATAEEATHEAFLQLIQRGARFDARRGSLEAYLYGMVRNLVRASRRNEPVESSGEPAADDDIVRTLIGDEAAAALYAAVRELPPAYREAVVLCDLEERTYEYAATLAGCPVGTIRSRLYRARRLLAAKLKPHKVSSRETTG
jgi:RNA polymerase sigma-70 factor, ECF subfamily